MVGNISMRPTPGGEGFVRGNGKMIAIACTGVAIVGASTIAGSIATESYYRMERLRRSQEALHRGKINARQFVLQQWRDGYPPKDIERQLLAWGGESDGISFSDPTAFAVEYKTPGSRMPRRIQTMCGTGSECVLRVRKERMRKEPKRVNQPGLHGGEKTMDLQDLRGLRGGARNEPASASSQASVAMEELESVKRSQDPQDQQQIAVLLDELQPYNSARRWPSQGHQSAVNQIFQLCEVDADKQEWERYTMDYTKTPFFSTPIGSTILWFGVAAGVGYAAWQASKKWWPNLFDSGGEAQLGSGQLGGVGSSKQLYGDVLPRETAQLVDPAVRALTASDSLLRVLRAFREGTLSWDAALAMLTAYHGKTEEEATVLLGPKPTPNGNNGPCGPHMAP